MIGRIIDHLISYQPVLQWKVSHAGMNVCNTRSSILDGTLRVQSGQEFLVFKSYFPKKIDLCLKLIFKEEIEVNCKLNNGN